MVILKVKELLEKGHVAYQVLEHEPAFTAQEIAGAQHLPGRQVVKPVIVSVDGEFVMCVLPAIHRIDFDKLKRVLGAKEVHLADESDVAKLFSDCEVGGEPPFGKPYGLRVYSDKILEENEEIAFNAGTHTDLIKIKYRDFIRMEQPIVADFGVHIAEVEEERRQKKSWEEEDNGQT